MVVCEGQSTDSEPGTGSSPNIMRNAGCAEPFFPRGPAVGTSRVTNRSRSMRDGPASDSPFSPTTVDARSGVGTAVASPAPVSSAPNRVRIGRGAG